ncbi:MAG: SUMF1/EgtB/PvdO family nonheme iron enzyme [Flavobacteriales bacterium]|nr:SUMF1/EgtB/PvdO family nonheme iron enzyme [Flavobacteriales bacterium]
MSAPLPIPKVFLCYAREDNNEEDKLRGGPWLKRLRQRLKPYELENQFAVFSDLQIPPGDAWDAEIQNQLQQASIVVVLVSDALLGSEYVRHREMPLILSRVERGEVKVVPVILNQCEPDQIGFPFTDSHGTTKRRYLTEFQCLGTPEAPLLGRELAQQDILLAQVAKEVSKEARRIASPPKPATPAPIPDPGTNRVSSTAEVVFGPHTAPRFNTPTLIRATIGVVALVVLGILLLRKPGPQPHGPDSSLTNSLGMVLVPIAGIKVWFCVWETRVRDYEAYAKANPGVDGTWKDPEYQGVKVTPGPDHPVVNVTWGDAQKFCEWLTTKERREGRLKSGQRYRLPTDLEWSWAVGLTNESGATAKDRNAKLPDVYPWGTSFPPGDDTGNFADESTRGGGIFRVGLDWIANYRDGYVTTSPVGSYPAMRNGLYDLAGNVAEWCEDWYDAEQWGRVERGGSWGDGHPGNLLSSARKYWDPEFCNVSTGFRVVLDGDGSAR